MILVGGIPVLSTTEFFTQYYIQLNEESKQRAIQRAMEEFYEKHKVQLVLPPSDSSRNMDVRVH